MKSKDAEVIVIGGGLGGASLALRLSELGCRTIVLERGVINRGASGTNAGTLHFQLRRSDARSPGRLALIRASIVAWTELRQMLGPSLGAKSYGGLMVAEGPAQVAALEANVSAHRSLGLSVDMLRGSELTRLVPDLARSVSAAMFCADEGSVNPLLATQALARRARELGAKFLEDWPVDEIRPYDHFFAVASARGTLRAANVVNAAGAWSAQVAAMVGVRLPVRGGRQIVSVTERWPLKLGPILQHIAEPLTLKQTVEGTFLIGGGWPAVTSGPEGDRGRVGAKSLAGNLATAARILPELRKVRLVRSWPGTVAMIPDRLPVVGPSEGRAGYYTLVVPRGAAGYTVTPYLAQQLAETIVRRTRLGPLFEEFSPDRWRS